MCSTMTKISKYDLCENCRQIYLNLPDDEKVTCGEMLDSETYNQPGVYYWIMNVMLLGHLETKGGCPSCINLVKRATQ